MYTHIHRKDGEILHTMIQANNISFSYGKNEIIRDVSFRVGGGECLVIAGSNGTGKSTLLSVLADIVRPSGGSVKTEGRIGYVPQGSALLEDATVEENLRFFAKLAKSSLPDTLPFSVKDYKHKKASSLSGGMKMQVSIACALMGNPSILLLDEPCASLDITFREEMASLVAQWKKEGKAVIYVGHDPAEFYPFYDSILFLDAHPAVHTRSELDEHAGTAEAFTALYKTILSHNKGDTQ